jgi:hypothetical protein
VLLFFHLVNAVSGEPLSGCIANIDDRALLGAASANIITVSTGFEVYEHIAIPIIGYNRCFFPLKIANGASIQLIRKLFGDANRIAFLLHSQKE